jgi:competence ComEA-like helix-hairpin-helix protein
MDPLAELVKIDPKSIGDGQYQHDVDQGALRRSLDDVVMSCVNGVGVELNTASKQLLSSVSGLGPSLAGKIVSFRDEHGPFTSRQQLMKVPRLGPKAFEQAAGFLRIRNAEHPLDASAVHPERYAVVDAMARDLKCGVRDLMRDAAFREQIEARKYVTGTVGLPTLRDILAELSRPGRDPREQFEAFRFKEGVEKLEDLQPGMVLPGIVTNVTAFGAFVDIGVHQDGLVHVSQLADRFVKDPAEVVKVQQKVTVTVVEVDVACKRIALSMRQHPVVGATRDARTGPAAKRPSGPPPPAAGQLDLLEQSPPAGQAQWDGPGVAAQLQTSVHAVWRVLRKEGICLSRHRSWCVSTDPEFATKAADIVGLYLNPPEAALVLSVDEKPSIQALERATGYVMTDNGKIVRGLKSTYKRHDTLNLFAALEVATGAIHTATTEKKRRIEFLAFMDEILAEVGEGHEIHVILDNYCIHKKNDAWLAAHPTVRFHFTPTSACWLNQVEVWFGILSRKALRGASFRSVNDVRLAIEAFVAAYGSKAKPFIWRKREVKGSQLRTVLTHAFTSDVRAIG